jgi:hypothetical protein
LSLNVCQVGTAGSLEVEKKSLTSATPLTTFPLLRLFSSLGSTQAVKFLLRGGGFRPTKLSVQIRSQMLHQPTYLECADLNSRPHNTYERSRTWH